MQKPDAPLCNTDYFAHFNRNKNLCDPPGYLCREHNTIIPIILMGGWRFYRRVGKNVPRKEVLRELFWPDVNKGNRHDGLPIRVLRPLALFIAPSPWGIFNWFLSMFIVPSNRHSAIMPPSSKRPSGLKCWIDSKPAAYHPHPLFFFSLLSV